LAMEVSSTSMNVAMVTVSAMNHGLNFGFQWASWMSVTAIPYFSQTFGTTDMPGRKRSRPVWPGLKRMRTGKRCTTLT
jgi:hypothetical protein